MAPSELPTMSPLRRLSVNGFILGYLGLCAFSNLVRHEGWPICNYPMFETIEHWKDVRRSEFFVVQGNREVRLNPSHHSIDDTCLEYAISHSPGETDWQSEKIKNGFSVLLDRLVDGWKADGASSDEPTALKVYKVGYHFPRSGDTTPQVISKTLLLEVDRTAP
jgi:hypothetical protein